MCKIKGEWEDLIYKNKEFIRELRKVADDYYDSLVFEMENDGFDKEKYEDCLFEYIFNYDGDDEFEEYLCEWLGE